MADIAAQPFINYGGQIAAQQNAQAQTGLAQAQTAGAQIENQNKLLQLKLFQDAVGKLMTTGDNGNLPTADNSGVSDTGEYGESAASPGALASSVRARYWVNPMGTQDEQNRVIAGYVSGNKSLADGMVARRDMAVQSRLAASNYDANNHFESAYAVWSAPPGKALDVLNATAPGAAQAIQRAHPDATPDELDQIVRDTAGHYAQVVHQYTGRETEPRSDGVYVDKVTKLPVGATPIPGLSAQQYSEMWAKANTKVTVKNTDGSEEQIEQYKANNYPTAAAWIAANVGAYQAQQALANHQNPAVASAARAHLAQHGNVPPANTPGSGSAPGALPQTQPGQTSGQPPGPNNPGADNGMLPGVNVDALPKFSMGPVTQSKSPNATQAGQQNEYKDSLKESLAQAKENQENTAKTNSILAQAQKEIDKMDPREAGPGSRVVKAMQDMYTALSGKAPDALVDRTIVDKFLNMVGAQNVRTLLSGQKITNQEMMLFMSRGSPNIDQPKQALQALVDYLKVDNDYTARLSRTQAAALRRGADPDQLNGAIENASHRSDYVQNAFNKLHPPTTAVTPPQTPGTATPTMQPATTKSGRKAIFNPQTKRYEYQTAQVQ